MTLCRAATVILFGAILAARAEAETIAYEALDGRSKVAIREACMNWVLREDPDIISFWNASISPLCAADRPPQPAPTQTPAEPAPAQ